MKERQVCKGYCGVSCVDGSCPMANREEYAERGYDIVHNCDECHYYKGCEDCCFDGTEMCAKIEQENDFIMKRFMRCE